MTVTALSPNQRGVLCAIYLAHGISYADERDRAMMALKRRDLARFQRRHKYGRNCWHLTESGTAEAAKRVAARLRKIAELCPHE